MSTGCDDELRRGGGGDTGRGGTFEKGKKKTLHPAAAWLQS